MELVSYLVRLTSCGNAGNRTRYLMVSSQITRPVRFKHFKIYLMRTTDKKYKGSLLQMRKTIIVLGCLNIGLHMNLEIDFEIRKQVHIYISLKTHFS